MVSTACVLALTLPVEALARMPEKAEMAEEQRIFASLWRTLVRVCGMWDGSSILAIFTSRLDGRTYPLEPQIIFSLLIGFGAALMIWSFLPTQRRLLTADELKLDMHSGGTGISFNGRLTIAAFGFVLMLIGAGGLVMVYSHR